MKKYFTKLMYLCYNFIIVVLLEVFLKNIHTNIQLFIINRLGKNSTLYLFNMMNKLKLYCII